MNENLQIDIAQEAAQRWVERQGQRVDEKKLDSSMISEIETPERIAKSLERMTKALIQQESHTSEVIITSPSETVEASVPSFQPTMEQTIPFVPTSTPQPIPSPPPTFSLLNDISKERIIGDSDMMGINFLERGIAVGRFVGRINIRNSVGLTNGYGTGFMVSPRLLLTNNHVLRSITDAKSSLVEFDFQLDRRGLPLPVVAFGLRPDLFFITNQKLDYTLIAVTEHSLNEMPILHYGWNRLSEEEGKILISQAVNIIQHPKGEYKQMVLRENKLIDLLENFAHYTADTEPGSSGSPVFSDLWEVVALHHSGVPKTDNKGNVLTKDGKIWQSGMSPNNIDWVANEGVRIGRIIKDLKNKMDGLPSNARQLAEELIDKDAPNPLEVKEMADNWKKPLVAVATPETQNQNITVSQPSQTMEVAWTIPLQVKINLGMPQLTPVTPTTIQQVNVIPQPTLTNKIDNDSVEEHISIDPNYQKREGYQINFLGNGAKRVNLPQLSDNLKSQVALNKLATDNDDPFELKYYHYSLVMNKYRKLAFFTAVNIDGIKSKSPNRENDKWFYDSRIKREEQIGNELYASNPLDRGHLVRRLDPAWGDDDDVVKVANDDTFHWTNCSPQHKNFNQGKNLWAGLEDYILKNANNKDFKVSVFTGPVFADDDSEYRGIKIPQRYWKVVVMVKQNKRLSATAYIVSQKELVANLEADFAFGQFRTFQVSVETIENLTGLDFGNLKDVQPAGTKSLDFNESAVENELEDYSEIKL